jgi:hypothetical protein
MKTFDLLPFTSGVAAIGVNMSAGDVFDATTISPYNRFHVVSGVWHDGLVGSSGVIRFNAAAPQFEVSLNGGLTFSPLSTGGVSSIGVIGDVNLTGAVDLATRASGFLVIEDSSDASPLLFALNHLGLSGFWGLPPQGLNGRVVNALTDFNGTEAQGVINVVGASGIVVDIIGQTMTVTNANVVPRCFSDTFGSSIVWTVTHNLNSLNVIVQCYDNESPRNQFVPDEITVTSANVVTVRNNALAAGLVVVISCP